MMMEQKKYFLREAGFLTIRWQTEALTAIRGLYGIGKTERRKQHPLLLEYGFQNPGRSIRLLWN